MQGGIISDWHAECVDFSVFPVMENAQKRSPTQVRRHTDTTDCKRELHKALLWGFTKELGFRTRCNQTQEVGTVINPNWHVCTSPETETHFPKMTCQKSHSRKS